MSIFESIFIQYLHPPFSEGERLCYNGNKKDEVPIMNPWTQEELDKVRSGYFTSQTPLKLRELPPRPKRKTIALSIVAEQIANRTYTEKEINDVLADIYDDYVTLRRELVDYGYIERTRDGRRYWKTEKKT